MNIRENHNNLCPNCGWDLDIPVVHCDAQWATGEACSEEAKYEGWFDADPGYRMIKIRVCEAHKNLLIGFQKNE